MKGKSLKEWFHYVINRRASFSFTVGSILFGAYYYVKPVSLELGIYKPLQVALGFFSGKYLGVIFVVLSVIKLIGLILDVNYLKLPLYFALLFLWSLLSICFFIALCMGYPNYLWILTGMIGFLSTNIISKTDHDTWRDAGG